MDHLKKAKWDQPAPSAAPGLGYIIAGFGAAWFAAAMVLLLAG